MEIRKVIAEKSLDVSKGSIERRVKERKRAERNHDDYDFVYPKQAKKTWKKTISQTQAEITDLDFDTTKKKKSQSRFRDLNKSILYKCLELKQQAIIKNFFDKATYELVNFFFVFLQI